MARKLVLALFALAAIGLGGPTVASAHGGHGGGGGSFHGGGGFHGGGFGGGFHSAAFHGGGFHGFHHGFHHEFHRRAFIGVGFAPYAYYDAYPYYDDGCYTVHRRVLTRYGWRLRPVQVCG